MYDCCAVCICIFICFSLYLQSPVSASPATLSPTSVPTGMRSPQGQAQFQFTNRPMSQHHNTVTQPTPF